MMISKTQNDPPSPTKEREPTLIAPVHLSFARSRWDQPSVNQGSTRLSREAICSQGANELEQRSTEFGIPRRGQRLAPPSRQAC